VAVISGIIKDWETASRFFSFPGFKKRTILRHHSLKDPGLAGKVLENLQKSRPVVLLYFDLVKFHEVEQVSGFRAASKILAMFKKSLEREMPEIYPDAEILAVENLWGDDFVVLMAMEGKPEHGELQKIATTFRAGIRERIKREYLKITGREPDIHVGYAVLSFKAENVESQLYTALREAREMARGSISLETAMLLSEFREILDQARFEIVYQPVVSLRSGGVLGWEALARGPRESYFRSPDVIFSFAEEAGLLYPVERVCRRLALEKLGDLGPDQKLFLNIHPRIISDPNFVRGETMRLIGEMGLKPSNIVFEITERYCIKDFPNFNKTLEHYRSQGYMVAVDDVGSGFSSLQSIAEIRPDFIKIDMSLVRDINLNYVKRTLLETFITFAEKIGCAIIAEGIETGEELTTLVNIGTHYGQGYFLGRPSFPKAYLDETVEVKVLRLASSRRNSAWKHAFPVGEIAENAVSVPKTCLVREVKELLEENELLDGVVVVEEGKPVGLVMRYRLDRYLGMQYGVPLYFDRPITSIMDTSPLVVEEDTPVEIISQAAMNRSRLKLYDYIIVTNNQMLKGVVSVQTLLDTMTRIRLEMARGVNPLTGLPGNIVIEQELSKRARENEDYAVIYLDLDYFKSYNDRYGFENGDRVILFTAALLSSVVKKFGARNDFIGHIGGDDFIIITVPEKAEILCAKTARYFDRLIRRFYDSEDRAAGGIRGYDRSGRETFFPLMSVSMAIVECVGLDYLYNLKEIAEKAAQLKRYAKSLPGSVYVKDRRTRVDGKKPLSAALQTKEVPQPQEKTVGR
jgi:EAL domain-containing protein (putative c-di-GMP-specific phosphodiesterase class I)/GGDEF domain-containing protein